MKIRTAGLILGLAAGLVILAGDNDHDAWAQQAKERSSSMQNMQDMQNMPRMSKMTHAQRKDAAKRLHAAMKAANKGGKTQ